jgi:hypothetical protein
MLGKGRYGWAFGRDPVIDDARAVTQPWLVARSTGPPMFRCPADPAARTAPPNGKGRRRGLRRPVGT